MSDILINIMSVISVFAFKFYRCRLKTIFYYEMRAFALIGLFLRTHMPRLMPAAQMAQPRFDYGAQ